MDIKAKIKESQARKKAGATAPAEAKPAKREKPPAGAALKHACGHAVPFRQLEQAFCTACIAKNRERRRLARAARQNQKQQEKADAAAAAQNGRLPDGAVFHLSWSAEKMTWQGTLTLGEQAFADEASAVFKLLGRLDMHYRASLEKQAE